MTKARQFLELLADRGEIYGVPIRKALGWNFGQVYLTGDEIQKRGWVSSRLADPTPERGNRAKRYYAITDEGRRALERGWADERSDVPTVGGCLLQILFFVAVAI